MANLAELDLAFSEPCKRCAQLLHGRVKFCPYCGGETNTPVWGEEAANAAFGPGRATPDPTEPEAPPADEPSGVPSHEVQETTDRPVVLDVGDGAREEVDLDIAHIVPAAFEWPDELPATIATVQPRTPGPSRGPILKYTAIGVAMAVSVLALVLGYVRSNQDSEAEAAKALTAQLAQAQSALGRGDLGAAERELAVLAADHPDHPGVRQLSDALDRRMQEQLARQEQLREAASKAAMSLGLGGPAPSPAKAPQATQASVAAAPVPVPPVAVQPPEKTACNAALAALALCPDAGDLR